MAIFDGLQRQLRSVIEWRDPDPDILLYQWTDNGDEIKNASKLIVGPGQGCIFVYEGRIRYVLQEEKMISVKSSNMPFWTTIKKFMQFFESEHKVGIYFFRTSKVLDQKWGTTSPIKYEDPKYNFPVGLKAYGNYSYRISDPKSFFVDIVGSHQNYTATEFRHVMSNRLVQPITDFLSESRYSYTDIDANREEIVTQLQKSLAKDFEKLGFALSDFRIEGTDFDQNTLKRINRIADLTAEAHAAEAVGMTYAGVQQMEAMREAARNEGGAAGIGMGLGAGMGFGNTMANAMGSEMIAGSPANSGSANQNSTDLAAKLSQLKRLFEDELIDEQDYKKKKQEILDKM
ncbi:MAG: SPFH domain-containing protein [Gammaproteobacteria bacterium]|nr:SPFH domain-containing protein [Gammaproteobacteria bacterium]